MKKSVVESADVERSIRSFCGDCHAEPKPDSFPADAWYAEAKRGFEFYRSSGRSDLAVPRLSDVVNYYRSRAPAELTWDTNQIQPIEDARFSQVHLDLPAGMSFPAVSHLLSVTQTPERSDLLMCDMNHGGVRSILFTEGAVKLGGTYSSISHPAHAEQVDLDRDGNPDWVIADLGSYAPQDHKKGRVIWVRRNSDGTGYGEEVLASGLGRVADVQVGDFDGDEDLDLVVAEFGWLDTGRVLLLTQEVANSTPVFKPTIVDQRHGAIHVPIADLDGDGDLDFIALMSQEHEQINAFLNDGSGRFERKEIFAAPDPAFGSSGIQLVDLDGDHDLDVLYTNGDMLDSFYVKPYHAIHWLENEGVFPFTHHEIRKMPGAMRAVAADLDRDGDNDIVACAHIALNSLRGTSPDAYDSLIWLEQQAAGEFVPHVLERSQHGYMALEVADFDGNSVMDIAVGHFANKANQHAMWLTLWMGQPIPRP